MPTINSFEDLEIWQLARQLVNNIYVDFKGCKDFAFRDQIIRACISIMNNISEGYGRTSDAEFRNFLNISKGSAHEVKSMYYIAEDQNLISPETANERRTHTQRIINAISSFMKYLKQSNQ